MAEKLLEKPADAIGKQRYTNNELGRLYYNLAITLSTSPFTSHGGAKVAMNKIFGSPVDIHDLYLKTGSLDDLKIPGIGKLTKAMLIDIFKNGTEAIRQRKAEEAGKQLHGFGSSVKLRIEDEERHRYPAAPD
jgi:hypothetical protein